jgi:lipoteichoic acid synthase
LVYSSTGLQKKPDPARSSIDAVTSSDSSSPDPSRPGRGGRVERLSNHTDVLPTVLEMLGYEIQNGEYPGYSLLREPPYDRTLFFSCWFEDQCLASIEGTEKYIYHYGNRPDELFDLSIDPAERENLADERSEEIDERRQDLLAWRSSVDAAYPPG